MLWVETSVHISHGQDMASLQLLFLTMARKLTMGVKINFVVDTTESRDEEGRTHVSNHGYKWTVVLEKILLFDAYDRLVAVFTSVVRK